MGKQLLFTSKDHIQILTWYSHFKIPHFYLQRKEIEQLDKNMNGEKYSMLKEGECCIASIA